MLAHNGNSTLKTTRRQLHALVRQRSTTKTDFNEFDGNTKAPFDQSVTGDLLIGRRFTLTLHFSEPEDRGSRTKHEQVRGLNMATNGI